MKYCYRILFLISFGLLSLSGVVAQTVVLGTGAAISVFSPLNRTNDYCVYEVIYLASQIGIADSIQALAFQRHDGTNVDPIDNVSIYMKHTVSSQLSNGNFDTTGFTLVYNGSFPNDAGAGWREVTLDNGFYYNNVENLQVLVVKDYQLAIANTPVTPRWIYTNISPAPARARRYYDEFPITSATQLTATVYASNARLTFGSTGIVEIFPGIVTVFPNPSSGDITFSFDDQSEFCSLAVYNMLGEKVYESVIPGKSDLRVTNIQPGVYLYKIEGRSNEEALSGKIVVN